MNWVSSIAAGLCLGAFVGNLETTPLIWGASAFSPHFSLQVVQLPPAMAPRQQVRKVNRSLRHIAPWVSSVGAGAAVGDLDGDGLPNDACLVDPRSDSVTVVHFSVDPTFIMELRAVLVGDPASLRRLADAGITYDPKRMAPMGCRIADFNEDGRADLLVYFWGRPPLLFLNTGQDFIPHLLVPESAGHVPIWNTNTAVIADFDGDGHLDIFIGNYFPDGAPVLDETADMPVEMNHSMSRAYNGGRNRILLRQPTGGNDFFPHFEQIEGVFTDEEARGWTLAAAAADIDGDGLPELYVANDFGPDRFFYNRSTPGKLRLMRIEGRRGIGDPSSAVLGRDSFKGMGVDIGDLDGDGLLDIVVSNITTPFGLHESQLVFMGTGHFGEMARGIAPFQQRAEDVGAARTAFAWDVKIADLDNDGRPEIIQATGFVHGNVNRWPEIQELAIGNDQLVKNPAVWPNLKDADISGSEPRVILTRGPDGRYVNAASNSGLTTLGVSRGIAPADMNGDGTVDWIEANQWANFRAIINRCSPCGAFLGLRLMLTDRTIMERTNIVKGRPPVQGLRAFPAIGAVAEVMLPNGSRAVIPVDGGSGHSGQRSPEIHVGLGQFDSTAELPVKLSWRDSKGQLQTEKIRATPGWWTVYLPW